MVNLDVHEASASLKRKRDHESNPFEETVSKVRHLEKIPTEKGMNGTTRFLIEDGRKVGVVKSHSSLVEEPLFRRIRLAIGQGRLLNYDAEIYNEFVGFEFSSFFNFNMSPQARMVGKNDVVIEFLEGYQDLKSLQNFAGRESFTDQEIELWQRMSLFNFLLGNLDPHSENLFVKLDQENHLADIKMIDFGNTMIEFNPEFQGLEGFQGAWGLPNIAKIPFATKVKEFIQKELTQEKLDLFFEAIAKDRPSYWTPNMKRLLKERLELVLGHLPASPCVLSKIHTSADFEAIIHPEKKPRVQTYNIFPTLGLGVRNFTVPTITNFFHRFRQA